MRVFKTFIKISAKNCPSSVLYLIIFLAIAIVMSQEQTQQPPTSFQQSKIKFSLDNKDSGAFGHVLEQYLADKNEQLPMPKTKEALMDSIYNREIDYVLTIPSDFTARLEQGQLENLLSSQKVPSSQNATLMDNQIQQYLSTLSTYLGSGFNQDEAISYTNQDIKWNSEVRFLNGQNAGNYTMMENFFLYLAYILIGVIGSAIGNTLMSFRRQEIRDRNNCSSISLFGRNLQIILGSIVVAVIALAVLISVGILISGNELSLTKTILNSLNGLVFLLFALSITFCIGQFINTINGIHMMSNVLGLSLSFIGGVFVPLELFSPEVLQAAKFTPTYWYVNTVTTIHQVEHPTLFHPDILIGFLIQIAFALAFACAGLLVSRILATKRS
jgi:ABC-2 type transport system permease protein